jgi:hypothetical protein
VANGSQLFDAGTAYIAVDQARLRGPLLAENGPKGDTLSICSKFEAQHLPSTVAARDGSYLADSEWMGWNSSVYFLIGRQVQRPARKPEEGQR